MMKKGCSILEQYVIWRFRSTSSKIGWHSSHRALQRLVSLGGFDPPPPTLFGMRPLHLNDSFDMCPFAKCFSIAHIRHIHFFDVSIFQNIIGLFRSTVLQVMSLTRFLCATMILCAPTTHILIYQLPLSCLLIYYNPCLPY